MLAFKVEPSPEYKETSFMPMKVLNFHTFYWDSQGIIFTL